MDFFLEASMLGGWDGVALRLVGAAALAAGLHAWRQVHRARARTGLQGGGQGAEQPLLAEEAAPQEAAAVQAVTVAGQDGPAGVPHATVAAAPAAGPKQEQQEQQQEDEEGAEQPSTSSPVPPSSEPSLAAVSSTGAEQQPAGDGAVPSSSASAAMASPAAAAPPAAQPAIGTSNPPEQPRAQLQQLEQAAAAPQADGPPASFDPADVHPAALGSPFVPPLLAPAQLGGADNLAAAASVGNTLPPTIPLFSSFVPPPASGASEAGAAAHVQLPPAPGAPAAAPASPSSDGGVSGDGPGSSGSQPRHRRRRSLLSEGQHGSQQTSGELEQEQLDQEQALLEGQRQLRADVAAQSGPAESAASSVPAAGFTPGRPELRVELPYEAESLGQQQPAGFGDAAGLYSPQLGQQQQQEQEQEQEQAALFQFQTPPQHQGAPGSRSVTPLGFQQQQQADAEAAAAAAAAAAAWGTQQQQQQAAPGGTMPDSVAAALQRAVHLAASGTAYPGSSAGGAGGPLPGPPPGASSAGFPGGVSLRTALSGGTFRSGSGPLSYPGQAPGFAHLQQQPHGHGFQGGGGGGDSAWGDLGGGFSMLAERSMTSRSDRHLPRLSEEVEGMRSSVDVDVPLACKLDVVAGPCTNRGYTNTEDVLEIIIGRNQGTNMQLNDGEISGQHAAVRWSSVDKCWKVADLGSLNGTLLNGEPISVAGRKRGRDYRLSTDDILQLGSFTKIKVSTFPRDLLDPMQSRCGSLPVGSMPKSLTMPKHRIPSFSSLLSPKITNTPSKKATVAAASDELRLECCIISRTGRDHQRKGQTCEDVACAECPLHGCEAALGSAHPAALFCVFDGHCGRGAADAASVALPDEVATHLEGVRHELLAAAGAAEMLRRAFLATDEAISAEEGCTATAVLMWRDGEGAVCLQAANVGDSAALFIDPDTQHATELTEDHRLTNPRERQRLQDMGIQLASNARRLYGLNLCRGLGDKFLKDEDLGLSAEPHVSPVVRLSEQQGGILLIASDGLWDVADAEAVTQAICQADREKDGNVLETTNAVIAHALKQRTKDDVTALVVRVWPASEWELRSPTKNLDDGEAAAFVS